MTIDTVPSRLPHAGLQIVDVRAEDARLVAVFDVTTSWDDEAVEKVQAAARKWETEWSWDFPRTAAQVVRDVGGDFEFGAVLLADGGCSVVLRWSYGALWSLPTSSSRGACSRCRQKNGVISAPRKCKPSGVRSSRDPSSWRGSKAQRVQRPRPGRGANDGGFRAR